MTDLTYPARSLTTSWPPPRRIAALAGIAAPLIFLAGIILATWLAWDYLHARGWSVLDQGDVPWPSGTALAEHGWVQSANFALTGTLLFLFVRTMRREFRRRIAGRIAGTLLTVLAVALALSAFNTDRAFGDAPSTWNGWVHALAFFAIMLSSLIGMPATALALRGNERWRGFPLGAVCVALLIPVGFAIPGGAGFYLFLLALFGWFELAALRLWKLSRRETP